MPASEYRDWMKFMMEEPYGYVRDNIHSAQLCALIANIHRRKGAPPVKAQEFMLRDTETRKRENMQTLVESFKQRGKRKDN